jgi:hypothetical protein
MNESPTTQLAQKLWDALAPKLWADTAWRQTQRPHDYDYVKLIERILNGEI